MMHVDKINLSTDESRMVAKSQLGVPLEVYRLKRGLLRFYYWLALFFFLMTLGVLLLLIGGSFHTWHEKFVGYEVPAANYFQFFFSQYLWLTVNMLGFFACVTGLVAGSILWRVVIPQARHERVIVCEEGVLRLAWKRRGYRIQAIRWTAIESIAEVGIMPEYLITYWKDRKIEKLSLDFSLEKLDELVVQIRQRVGKISNE